MPDVPISVRAHAKINLFLRIVGRRADGYHLLESLVAFADPHDAVSVSHADHVRLRVDGPFAGALDGPPNDNLVYRAAELLRTECRVAGGADIALTKTLPVASGIGGGSADAAAALLALSRLWDLHLSAAELAALGLKLGADVPVCLAGQPALMSGIGETLTPVPTLPRCGILLVNPGVPVSTAAVFRARPAQYAPPAMASAETLSGLSDAAALAAAVAAYDNDLAESARTVAPVIDTTLAALRATPHCLLARLSGSGATCFGLYEDAGRAEAAAAHVTAAHPGWWVAPGSLRNRAQPP